ncbi:MAG TPA: SDR family NAD(P)-dependent oxidoreductase [Blastocatellia bacterium]|nr:SDR family NAD(P)-dependent oxidoreductase [Blastocatellia bacterium]
MFDFSNRVVVITGAAGNLGASVAGAFGRAGAKLALVDRGTDRLPKMFPDLANSPDHFLATGVDLGSPASVEAMAAETVRRLGRIDVLVNTVGGYRAGTPLHETPVEDWDFLLNLNARSVFIACRAVVPHMLRQGGGKIINTSSRAAFSGDAGAAAYSASKSAVVRLTESLSADVKASGINVNCVLPGMINTPQNRAAIPDADHSRWVEPEALADAIMFLASDEARAIHGVALPVYGLN